MEPGSAAFESERRYQSVIAAMTEGVVVQDATSVIVACNRAAEQLLGLTADQMMGRTSLDPRWRSIHEDGSPFPGDTHPASITLRTGEPQRDVVMGVHKPDGTLTWISINSEPLIRDGEAAPYAVVTTFSDITERKRANDAVRRSEERYRGIVETTSDGVWVIDGAGTTTFGNRRMAELLGCTADQLARSTLWELIDDADRERFAALLAAGGGAPHQCRLRRAGGDHVWVSIATSPFTLPDGGTGVLAMVRDVSHAHQLEVELRESKERLELALAVGEMGTWEWSLATDHAAGSLQLREILGLPADAPLDTPAPFWGAVHPDDRAALEASMTAYLARGATERFTNNFRIVRPDGSIRWVRSAGRLVVTPAGERRVLGTLVDFTESHALEERLHRAQQLESIGRLAGGVAHDFNNLLTAILASVAFAEAANAPAVADELRTIRTAAERGADLTRQLLAFARKQVMHLAQLDLGTILRDLTGVLRRLAGESIALEVEVADSLWPVRAGASQLEQVIVNLVVNARDAMPAGGPLRIAARNTVVDDARTELRPGDYVTLTVADAGVGIEPAALPHIFEPFFSTKQTGTGLGLASSYGIVRQLGGDIRVDSTPGAGTTFTVYLPRDRTQAAAPPPAPAPAASRPASRATLLVVEDDALLRGVITRSLADAGYAVLAASDGEHALALAADHPGPIALLITDVIMPKLSGPRLGARFAAIHPETQILYVSGHTEDVLVHHGVTDPERCFLAKPYTLEALEHRIAQLLAGTR